MSMVAPKSMGCKKSLDNDKAFEKRSRKRKVSVQCEVVEMRIMNHESANVTKEKSISAKHDLGASIEHSNADGGRECNYTENIVCSRCDISVQGWNIHMCKKFSNPKQKTFVRCASANACVTGQLVSANGRHACKVCKKAMHTVCGDGTEGAFSLCALCNREGGTTNSSQLDAVS